MSDDKEEKEEEKTPSELLDELFRHDQELGLYDLTDSHNPLIKENNR